MNYFRIAPSLFPKQNSILLLPDMGDFITSSLKDAFAQHGDPFSPKSTIASNKTKNLLYSRSRAKHLKSSLKSKKLTMQEEKTKVSQFFHGSKIEGKIIACWLLHNKNSPVHLLSANKHDDGNHKVASLKWFGFNRRLDLQDEKASLIWSGVSARNQ